MLRLTTSKITEIFVDCDDFMLDFDKHYPSAILGEDSRPSSRFSASEVMTVCILYHHSRMDCFKSFYELVIRKILIHYFPAAPSYSHFVKLKKYYLFELFAFLWSKRLAPPTLDGNQVDSKKMEVCHIKREKQHQVMKGLACKGKSSTGWFFGLKLHLIINEYGQICRFVVSSGNQADNNERILKQLFKGFLGTFYGDRGYLTKLKSWLAQQGVTLISKVRKKMKQPKWTAKQRHYLKKRGIIETVFGLLTFQCDIDHTRHRSQSGFFINLFTAIIAYSYFDQFPQVKRFTPKEIMENNIVLIQE